MAMISCAECGKRGSDMAKACSECGFPISEYVSALKVRIEYPSKALTVVGKIGESLTTSVIISDESGNELSRLKPGEMFTFSVSEPMKIGLSKGLTPGKPSETVYPGDSYEIRFTMMLGALKLVKVGSLM